MQEISGKSDDSFNFKFLVDEDQFKFDQLSSLKRMDSQVIFQSECFGQLFECLEVFEIVLVYIALLLERRVIFVSSRLNVLSECIHSLVALLWPLTWQVCSIYCGHANSFVACLYPNFASWNAGLCLCSDALPRWNFIYLFGQSER